MSNNMNDNIMRKGNRALTTRDHKMAEQLVRDFCYGEAAVKAVWHAKTESDLEHILIDARHGKRVWTF